MESLDAARVSLRAFLEALSGNLRAELLTAAVQGLWEALRQMRCICSTRYSR